MYHEDHGFRLDPFEQGAFHQKRGDVVGEVADDPIVRGIVPFGSVAIGDVDLVAELFLHLGDQRFVDVDRVDDAFGLGEEEGQGTRAGTDFEDLIPRVALLIHVLLIFKGDIKIWMLVLILLLLIK